MEVEDWSKQVISKALSIGVEITSFDVESATVYIRWPADLIRLATNILYSRSQQDALYCAAQKYLFSAYKGLEEKQEFMREISAYWIYILTREYYKNNQ
jgi:hypothetical protein